jgi:hypothetical protein
MTKVVPLLAIVSWLATADVFAQGPALIDDTIAGAIASETSGEAAKRTVEYLARLHRMRGSRDFHSAAEHIVSELKAAGLGDALILQFPADGATYYGTQKARPAWDAEFAELWELRPDGGQWVKSRRLASWEAAPVALAQDSESGETTTSLVDVGAGTSPGDYEGKDVRGKLVLTSSQPGEVAPLAVDRHGAAGIVSYAQNQRSAWWGEDENLVRWGHLDSFTPTRTFAFMVSLKTARAFRERLAQKEEIQLYASVRAGRRSGVYEVVTATIPGADAARRAEEVAFSCHLDHQRPGANDNASGCAAILEAARTLATLIREKRVAAPARTLRFIWPPEIEGTLVLLTARPDIAARIKAVVHMDMVGGAPAATKAVFHVTRGPASLPSFVNDVAEAIARVANSQTEAFAGTGRSSLTLHAPEGGKEAWQAEAVEFTLGSDHQVYADSSFAIPAIYLNDWPDRYIHTNADTAANIDPTKLKRASFLGAASAYVLASFDGHRAGAMIRTLQAHSLRRAATMLERRRALDAREADVLTREFLATEQALVDSVERFTPVPADVRREAAAFLGGLASLVGRPPERAAATGDARAVFRRNPAIKGPMAVFGYDYFLDKYGAERAASVRLLGFSGLRGAGGDYAYDALNLVDGRRTAQEIRDVLAAAYGPVPLDQVVEFLQALASIQVIVPAPGPR